MPPTIVSLVADPVTRFRHVIEYCMSPHVLIYNHDQHFFESTVYQAQPGTITASADWGWRVRLAAHLCSQLGVQDSSIAQTSFD